METGANLLRKKLGEPTWKTLGRATVEALVRPAGEARGRGEA